MMTQRCFLAIAPSPAHRLWWQEAVASLTMRFPNWRWLPPPNLHVTMVFLGEVRVDTELPAVLASLPGVCQRFGPLRLCLHAPLFFPSRQRPRLVAASVAGDGLSALLDLQAQLVASLSAQGLATAEGRSFRPHITLGRSKTGADAEGVADTLVASLPWWGRPFEVTELALMSSTLATHGSTYQALAHVPLAAPPS